MRYVFKVLILGDPETCLDYVVNAFQEGAADKETYYEWYKEFNALDDICDLEINLITDFINADYDEIISTVDGIIYFLNPLNTEESELFEMLYSIIDAEKKKSQRNIPTIIMYYDNSGVIPISTNLLLENLWVNSPELEAFVNLPPYLFHQALQCLCIAMISGESPLNIENAWMRFPIFIQLANIYFKQQKYYYAAQAMKKAATISEIYNSNEFYIHCEQAAYLFSKINLYLEASKILESVDKKKYNEFRRQYHNAMILEGTKLFNQKEYEIAANQYEKAGQWASIELDDYNLVENSFKLAINSWISACKCEKAFIIIERLPHEKVLSYLNEISDKIIKAVDYLVSIGNLNAAKEQMYYSIFTYQREALFDVLKKFTLKQVDILKKIMEYNIENKEPYIAKEAYDEIENLWESYKVKKINLDKQLEKLIKFFIEELNTGMTSTLINKLNSFKLKEKLTELSSKAEEQEIVAKRKEIEENIQKGLEIIKAFMDSEQNIISEININIINEANEYIAKNEHLNAAKIIKNQSIFLNRIGKEEIGDQILTKSLDILLDANKFDQFFNYYSDLSEEMKKEYLSRIFPHYIEILKELINKETFEKNDKIFEVTNRNYRNLMLYNESKDISRLYIKMIKREALKSVEIEENLNGINKATDLIKKVNNIFSAYLDKEKDKVTFNRIYKKIAEIYLSLEDFSSTQTFIDKLEKVEYKEKLAKELGKKEAEKSAIITEKVKETIKGEMLKDKLSIIKQKARDAQHDRSNELKQRKGLKRAYLKNALTFLKEQEYNRAILLYKESVIRLNRIQKYNLAGVSLAIASLLYMKQDKYEEIKKLIDEVEKELSTSGKLFLETFPVTLIEYILDMKKFEDEAKFKEAISFLEHLPLFEDEIKVLYDFLGKEYIEELKEKELETDIGEIAKIRSEISNITNKIEIDKQEFAKRKIMKRDYWDKAIEELSRKNYLGASKIYLESFEYLVDKKLFKQASIGLILGSIIFIKEKDFLESKKVFEDTLKNLRSFKEEVEAFAEIKLLEYLFLAYENNFEDIIKSILTAFARKLMLFGAEQDFLIDFSGEKLIEEEKKLILTRKEKGELSKLQVKFDQIVGIIQQKMGDVKSGSKDLLNKRQAFKKRYYKDILTILNEKLYSEVANKYLDLANTFAKRKDYEMSALHILLYGLSALKSDLSSKKILTVVNEYLESLGLSKRIVKETYYITLILLILDVKIEGLDQYNPKINMFTRIIPTFDEEKELLKVT